MNTFLEEKLLPQMVACSQVVIALLMMVSFVEITHVLFSVCTFFTLICYADVVSSLLPSVL